MKIKKSYSLQDLQKQFSNEFPGLKIEFFRPVYAGYEGPYDLLHYSNTTKLSAISPDVKSIEFELDDTEEVGQFEARFSKLIGVDVQVRIVDAVVIILGAVEHDGASLETIFIAGLG